MLNESILISVLHPQFNHTLSTITQLVNYTTLKKPQHNRYWLKPGLSL